jgi:hypothetical protein
MLSKPGQAESPTKLEITPEMLTEGARIIAEWEASDEPDVRVCVRALLSRLFGDRVTFGSY